MTDYDLTLVTPKYPPHSGGAARYYGLLTTELSDRDRIDQITVLTSPHESAPLVERRDEAAVYRILPRSGSGSRVQRTILFLLRQILLVVAISLLCLVRDDHVIQIHSTVAFVGRIGFNHVLDRMFQGLSSVSGSKFVLDIRDQHTIPTSVNGFDAIICASESICNEFNRVNRTSDVTVVHLRVPVDIDAIRGHDKDRRIAEAVPDRYICFVGDISAAKGTKQVVEAAAGIDAPPVVLVGDPVDETGRKLVSSLPEHVSHLGVLSHDEALQVIDGATMLVLPSESEGFPRVILEAIALGTPVVVSATVPELVDAAGVRNLDSRSVAAIRNALQTEISDEQQSYQIHQHDVGHVCTDLIAFHRSLLG
ncbi:glycosyltransferase family 4 protein [Halorientalis marina]|uniref:glycosyltransferase family 4 protein n=1 Tax=Halorientalis marina TaxID=2931976 RepID=UPI001FF60F2F|nr:glycosyltransferase family 4 protein [Halorientalis marina]